MQKEITISASTPAGNLALAESILGKVVEPVKTRWNPGSLLSSALSNITAATLVVLSPTFLRIFLPADETESGSLFSELIGSVTAGATVIQGLAADGTTKVRALLPAGGGQISAVMGGSLDIAANSPLESNSDALTLAELLFVPASPTFSALSLASRIDSYFQNREVPEDFTLVINQFDGSFFVLHGEDLGALPGIATEPAISYELTEPSAVVDPEAPPAPVWG